MKLSALNITCFSTILYVKGLGVNPSTAETSHTSLAIHKVLGDNNIYYIYAILLRDYSESYKVMVRYS